VSEMKDGLPVLEAEPGFMEAMARKAAEMQAKTNPDPLACQVDVNTLIANYEAIIGQLTGQLTQLRTTSTAFEQNARKVVEGLQQRITELEHTDSSSEAETE
jgi:hypothetical protein